MIAGGGEAWDEELAVAGFVVIDTEFDGGEGDGEAAPGGGAFAADEAGLGAAAGEPGEAGEDVLDAVGVVGIVEDEVIAVAAFGRWDGGGGTEEVEDEDLGAAAASGEGGGELFGGGHPGGVDGEDRAGGGTGEEAGGDDVIGAIAVEEAGAAGGDEEYLGGPLATGERAEEDGFFGGGGGFVACGEQALPGAEDALAIGGAGEVGGGIGIDEEIELGRGDAGGFRDIGRHVEVLTEEAESGLALIGVVAMFGVDVERFDMGGRAEEGVDFVNGGELDGGRLASPISGGGEQEHGAGGEGGGELHVVGADAETGGHFTGIVALEVGGDHDGGDGDLDAVIDGGEEVGLCAATGGAGDGEALRVDIIAGCEIVGHAERVPELEGERAEGPEAFVVVVAELVGELAGVVFQGVPE